MTDPKPYFEHAVTLAEPPSRCLNYVWINKEKFDPEDERSPACGVPLHYIDMSIRNAQKYPDTEVNIWLDYDLLDQKTIDITQKHLEKAGLSNIQIRDLEDIPAYKNGKTSLFDPNRQVTFDPHTAERERHNIWGRVDLARLFVLRYCLETTDMRDVIYADFEIADVSLDKHVMQALMSEHGMAFGAHITATQNVIPENDYFAFRRDKMDPQFFNDLVNETERIIAESVLPDPEGINGYGAFYNTALDWFAQRGDPDFEDLRELATQDIFKPMGQSNIHTNIAHDCITPS